MLKITGGERNGKEKHEENTEFTLEIQTKESKCGNSKKKKQKKDEKIRKDIRNTENYCHYVDEMHGNKAEAAQCSGDSQYMR